ncbi:unnamed protein product [Effrenium voratum]|nr:unnamed protein product [Effrenium voratum]
MADSTVPNAGPPDREENRDQKDYVQKLERSFAARRWCDHGTFSEPIMMHSLFVEWVRAGAPRGVKSLGAFVRDWSVIPKKFESLSSDATDLTVPASSV